MCVRRQVAEENISLEIETREAADLFDGVRILVFFLAPSLATLNFLSLSGCLCLSPAFLSSLSSVVCLLRFAFLLMGKTQKKI